jgi:hypothetical protein
MANWPHYTQFNREDVLQAGRGLWYREMQQTQLLLSKRDDGALCLIGYVDDWSGGENFRDGSLWSSHHDCKKFFNMGARVTGLREAYSTTDEVKHSLQEFGFSLEEAETIISFSIYKNCLPSSAP